MGKIDVVIVAMFLAFFPGFCGADIDFSADTYTTAVISTDTDNTNKDFDGIALADNLNLIYSTKKR